MFDMSAGNQFALAAFQQAREHFTLRRFAEARRVMADYRRLIQYQAFRHADRRPKKGLPTCSVIIVSHAAGDGLLKCLDTILAQRHSAFEVILIDNGGNEALLPVLQRKPILHVLCPMNLLPSEARNVGAYFARGPVLVFVDDDGQVCQGYLRQAEQALRIPQVIGVRGRILPLTSEGASNSHYDLGLKSKPAAFNLEGNMAIRRGVFRAAGGFDPLMFGHEGHELTERCQRLDPSFQVRYWPELLLYHDFAQGTRLQAKRERQQLGSDYKEFIKKLYPCSSNFLINEPRSGGNQVSQAGISVVLRAGKNLEAARDFLEQFARINTYKSVEILVYFSAPLAEHISLIREFSNRLSVIILPSKNRAFDSIGCKICYDQVLLATAQSKIKEDVLEEAHFQLASRREAACLNFSASYLSNVSLWKAGFLFDSKNNFVDLEEQRIEAVAIGNESEFSELFYVHNRKAQPRNEKRNEQKNIGNSTQTKHGQHRKLLNKGDCFSNKTIHESNHFMESSTLPVSPNKEMDLKVAFLGDEHLFSKLETISEVVDLKERMEFDAEYSLGNVDLFLATPSLTSSGKLYKGEWLEKTILHFKSLSIPTVFWYTDACEHASMFVGIAREFDYIYAVEEKTVNYFSDEIKREVGYLPWGITPPFNNAFRRSKKRPFINLNVMYDGWADLIEFKENRDLLVSLDREDILVFDSDWRFNRNKLMDFPDLRECIIGCITAEQRLQVLKEFNILLITHKTLKSSARLRERVLEALSAKTLVICYGDVNLGDVGKLVEYYHSYDDIKARLDFLNSNPILLKSKVQKLWREVHSTYTLDQSLAKVISDIGIRRDKRCVKVSCITVTKRPQYIDNIINNFSRQTYGNKELIVVFNTAELDFSRTAEYIKERVPCAVVYQISSEKNIGFCLNYAVSHSSGSYWAKMDDDDRYGSNYIYDYIKCLKCGDLDLIGKKMGFTYFEALDAIYYRDFKKQNAEDLVCTSENFVHMSGATFFGKKELVSFVPFSESVRSAVDSSFFLSALERKLNVVVADDFNLTVYRAASKDHHTWKSSDESLMSNSIKICSGRVSDLIDT